MDSCSLPGSSVHKILQARILEWVAIPSSRGSSWPRDQTRVSCIAGVFFTIWATREANVWSVYTHTNIPHRPHADLYYIVSFDSEKCSFLILSLPLGLMGLGCLSCGLLSPPAFFALNSAFLWESKGLSTWVTVVCVCLYICVCVCVCVCVYKSPHFLVVINSS